MKLGKGANKGADWERRCCRVFSRWFTKNPNSKDIFWRKKTGGDMLAIDPRGAPLVEKYSFEFKTYKNLNLFELLDPPKKGEIEGFWRQCKGDAGKAGKIPWLIMKRNRFRPYMILPTVVVIDPQGGFRFIFWQDFDLRLNYVCSLYDFLMRVPPERLLTADYTDAEGRWMEKWRNRFLDKEKLYEKGEQR